MPMSSSNKAPHNVLGDSRGLTADSFTKVERNGIHHFPRFRFHVVEISGGNDPGHGTGKQTMRT